MAVQTTQQPATGKAPQPQTPVAEDSDFAGASVSAYTFALRQPFGMAAGFPGTVAGKRRPDMAEGPKPH